MLPASRRAAAAKAAAAPAKSTAAGPATAATRPAAAVTATAARAAHEQERQQAPAAKDARDGDEDEQDHQKTDQPAAAIIPAAPLQLLLRRRGALFRFRGIQRQLLDQRVDAGLHPAIEIVAAEFGQYLALDHHRGKGV